MSIGAKFLFSHLLLLLLEEFPFGGHRARKNTQFNVIDHSEFKYKVSSQPGVAIWEIKNDFGYFKLQKARKG